MHDDTATDAAIARAERKRELYSRGMVHYRDGHSAVTEEMTAIHTLKRVERLAHRICRSSEPAHEPVRGRHGPSYRLTRSFGSEAWLVIKGSANELRGLFPGYVFNPHITVMLKAIDRAWSSLRWFELASGLPVYELRVRKILDHFLEFVRRVTRSKRFRTVVNNHTRNARQGYRSCCDYVRVLFAAHSKLLVLRVDLYYLPDDKGWADEAAAQRGVRKFRRDLREGRVVPALVGSICKRENGFRRGMHYHWMIFLDGHRHRDAANLSKMIGEYWIDRCTGDEKKGQYFNCYTIRDMYALNGLGPVHATDREKLMGIREAIRYITKPTHQLKTGYDRNLFRGVTPSSVAPKRGAPRKCSDLSVVDEILG